MQKPGKFVFLITIPCKFPKQIQHGSFESSVLLWNTACGLNWLDECSVANNLHPVDGVIRLYANEGKSIFFNLSEIKYLFQNKWLGNAWCHVLYCAVLYFW